MSWVAHVKDYQKTHGCTYREALVRARSSWRSQKGTGVMDRIFAKISKVKDAIFFPPNKLPGDAQRVFDRMKDATINKIMVNRAPVNGMVDKALNLLSLGTYDKAKKDLGYDKMFHLSMVLFTNKGKIAVQKNERISITPGGSGGGQSIDLTYPNGDTFAAFMEKARSKMGDHRFFQYNAFENNCQDFIIGCLQANGVLSAEARSFIKQDAEGLIKKMPGYMGRVAQAATDLGGKINQLRTGQGRKVGKGQSLEVLLRKVARLDGRMGEAYDAYEVLRVIRQIKTHPDVRADPHGMDQIQPYIAAAERRAKHFAAKDENEPQAENKRGNGKRKKKVKL